MSLSVVVCTHDRPRELERCLTALAALEDEVEVVVVDSASRRPVQPLVERFGGVRYVRVDEPGLSRARNAGLAATGRPLVAFLDDDTEPAADWARVVAAPFDDPLVGCVGGACLPAFAAARPRWLSDRLLQYAGVTNFGGSPREAVGRHEYPFGANICFRRDVLRDGFPEHLGRMGGALLSGEEVAAIDAVRRSGFRVLLEPRARVRHLVSEERCRSGYYWRRLWWQGITRARGDRSAALTLRLLVALPVRLALYLVTRDRVHLYRTAETTGYLRELLAR